MSIRCLINFCKRHVYALLVSLFIIGVFISRYIASQDYLSIGVDPANYLITMRQAFGNDPSGMGLLRPPLIGVILKPFITIFGMFGALKLVGLLVSVLPAIPMYLIAKLYMRPCLAFIGAATLIIYPDYVMLLAWGYLTLAALLTTLFAVYFFIVLQRNPGKFNAFMLGMFVSLTMGLHQFVFAMLLIISCIAFSLMLLSKVKINWRYTIMAISIAVILSVPYIPVYLHLMSLEMTNNSTTYVFGERLPLFIVPLIVVMIGRLISPLCRRLPKGLLVIMAVNVLVILATMAHQSYTSALQVSSEYFDDTQLETIRWVGDNTDDDDILLVYPNNVGWWIRGVTTRNTYEIVDRDMVTYQFEADREIVADRILSGDYGIENNKVRLSMAGDTLLFSACVDGMYHVLYSSNELSLINPMLSGQTASVFSDVMINDVVAQTINTPYRPPIDCELHIATVNNMLTFTLVEPDEIAANGKVEVYITDQLIDLHGIDYIVVDTKPDMLTLNDVPDVIVRWLDNNFKLVYEKDCINIYKVLTKTGK